MDGTVHDPGMEGRVERLEQDMHEVKATLGRLEPMIVSIHAQIPFLATKVELEALRGELKTDMANLRGGLKNDVEILRGELARKPSVAAMWSMGLSLFTLVVAAMAAGAAYLPLISNSLHAST